MRKPLSLLPLLALLAACAATVPNAPSVLVLPGIGKSFEQFHGDDQECRRFAHEELEKETAPGARRQMQRLYDNRYQQCMYGRGHRIPAYGTMAQATPPGYPPPYPAGLPPR